MAHEIYTLPVVFLKWNESAKVVQKTEQETKTKYWNEWYFAFRYQSWIECQREETSKWRLGSIVVAQGKIRFL